MISSKNKKCDHRSSRTKNANLDSRQTNTAGKIFFTPTESKFAFLSNAICGCEKSIILPKALYFPDIQLVWHPHLSIFLRILQEIFKTSPQKRLPRRKAFSFFSAGEDTAHPSPPQDLRPSVWQGFWGSGRFRRFDRERPRRPARKQRRAP